MKRLSLAIALSIFLAAQALGNCVLRQSDAAELKLGPFVDATDGVTAETGLTLSQGDILIAKCAAAGDCGAYAQKNDSSACAHDAGGNYECDFNATDLDTVGILEISVQESGAVPVFKTCFVLDTAPFDADYADAATGRRAADVTHWLGTAAATPTVAGVPEVDLTHWLGTAPLSLTSQRPQVSVGAMQSSVINSAVIASDVDVRLGLLRTNTAQSATATTLVLDASSPFADDTALGMTLIACGSTQGYCQSRAITDYVTSTDTATVDTWTVTPSGTITYYIFGTAPGSAGDGATAAEVWAYGDRQLTAFDEDVTTMDLNATSTGAAASVTGAVGSVTGAVGSVTGAVGSVTAAVTLGNDSITSAILAASATAEIVAAQLAAQGTITGTCDSGSTTTCVDNALTQADASMLEDRLICFDDQFCGLITTFTPGSDTATTTKVAPSTRASKVYTIFPSTLE